MTLQGKGFFTWKIPSCEGGNAGAIASVAKSANLTHVLVKVADGVSAYNGNWNHPVDLNPPVIQALRNQGIQVWGWQYVYGDRPMEEARIAIQRVRQFNLDGFVVDAETQYETAAKRPAAQRFMGELRSALPDMPVALSSFRYPSLHSQLPWKEFLDKCDYVMPQVYWMQAHNPAVQLSKTVREFKMLNPQRPVIPTGAAFREFGWQPSMGEVVEFLQAAKSLNLSAVNFWEWGDARSGALPGVWDAIRDFPWQDTPAIKDVSEQFVEALNTRNLDKVLSFYSTSAVHVNAARTVSGIEALRGWYTTVFNQLLPGATFRLTGYSGAGASRHFTWTATSSRGKVDNGNDTLGLLNGKIAYHYTFFTIASA